MTEIENMMRERWGLALDDGLETAPMDQESREPTPTELAAQLIQDVQDTPAEPVEEQPSEQEDVDLKDTQAAALPDPGSQAALKARLRRMLAKA